MTSFAILEKDDYMERIRRIIVGIISVVYLILVLLKIDIPRNLLTILLFIVLVNQAIDEWINYKNTNKKVHLLIPISGVILVIYVVSNLIYVALGK